jgi:glycosyltransferase involved in cell wall biosynthesis
VLVLPSFREGTPRVITEAMASGLPVVATDIAGIPEQVHDGKNGYLVPTGDAAAVRERLGELVEDYGLRERMGERGLERVEAFSIEAMVGQLDGVYQDLLNRSK